MYLLDTNVVSELRKGRTGRAEPRVVAWADGVDAGSLYLSAITILELELGVALMERRDPAQGVALRAWLERVVIPEFEDRTLAFDAGVARRCARLHVPDPRSERDAMIAATALVHGMTVVTRNLADFDEMGAPLLNPWEGP